jgi:peptidoglycan hydrolase-like protein with peptidoglycan-binding domain
MENLPVLGIGSRGADVRALQQFLAAQGMQVAVDGDFGPQTQRAVAEFQQRAGIPVDGTVGPQTYGAIAQAAGQGQQQASPQPRPRPQSVVNPAPRQQHASTSAPVSPVQQGGPLPPPQPTPQTMPQIATAQVQPPQDMWQAPGNANNGRRPQSQNTFPVGGGGAYGPGQPVPRNLPPGPAPQQPGNYPMLPRMAMGGVYPGGNRPPISATTQPPNQPYPGIEGLMADPSMSWPPPGPSMGDVPAAPASFNGGPPTVPNMGILPPGGRSYGQQTPMAQGPNPEAILGALVQAGIPPEQAVRVLGNLAGA